MRTLSRTAVTVLAAFVLAVSPGPATHTGADPLAPADSLGRLVATGAVNMQPAPELTPGQVVRIVLEALSANDNPYQDAGVEVAYRFSSPDNQQTTGPIEEFMNLVHNPVYSPVLNHQHARFGHIDIVDGKATVPVVIVSENAERHGFLFTLKLQSEGHLSGCWLTESVIPFEVEDADAGEDMALMNT